MTDVRWHVAKWHFLAWVETLVKLLAIGVAIYSLTQPIIRAEVWNTLSVLGVAILGLLSAGIALAILDRLRRREIVSMVFVILNVVGHGIALAYAVLARGITPNVATFAAAMLAGDLIKIAFIRKSDFTLEGVSKGKLIGLTLLYVAGYAAVFGLSAASGV
jgi:hypothetical protein